MNLPFFLRGKSAKKMEFTPCVGVLCCGFFGKGHVQACMTKESAKAIFSGFNGRSPASLADIFADFALFTCEDALRATRGLSCNLSDAFVRAAYPSAAQEVLVIQPSDNLKERFQVAFGAALMEWIEKIALSEDEIDKIHHIRRLYESCTNREMFQVMRDDELIRLFSRILCVEPHDLLPFLKLSGTTTKKRKLSQNGSPSR